MPFCQKKWVVWITDDDDDVDGDDYANKFSYLF